MRHQISLAADALLSAVWARMASQSWVFAASSFPSEQPLPGDGVIDTGRMRDLIDNLEDGLTDVVEAFLDDSPLLIQTMRDALAKGDMQNLQRVAHSLKSSAGIFGAHRMIEGSLRLEKEARPGGSPGVEMIDAVEEAFSSVRSVLNLYLPGR